MGKNTWKGVDTICQMFIFSDIYSAIYINFLSCLLSIKHYETTTPFKQMLHCRVEGMPCLSGIGVFAERKSSK